MKKERRMPPKATTILYLVGNPIVKVVSLVLRILRRVRKEIQVIVT